MAVNQEVTLFNKTFGVPQVVHAVQNDTNRNIVAYLGDFTLISGMTAALSIKRPDGTYYKTNGTVSTANNNVTVNITQALTKAGTVNCSLKITESAKVVSTYLFNIEVQEDTSGTITPQEGGTVIDALDKANQAVETAEQAVETAEAAMDDAEDVIDFVQGITSELAPSIKSEPLSGPVVTFNNGAKYWPVNECVVALDLLQEGTGDPSPTNVRPINSWTEVNVTAVGRNFITLLDDWSSRGLTRVYNADGSFTLDGTSTNTSATASNIFQNRLPAGQYILSGDAGNNDVYIRASTESGDIVASHGGTFTLSTKQEIRVQLYFRANSTVNNILFKPMLRLASDLNPDYEPYKGNTATISLGRNVYSGTLDVTRGKLIVDCAGVDLGTLSWTYASGSTRKYYRSSTFDSLIKVPEKNGLPANIICTNYLHGTYLDAYDNTTDKSIGISTSGQVAIYDTTYTNIDATAADFKTAMSGVMLVYELTTPQEYDVTPTDVNTILGLNNIWADSGDILKITLTQDTKGYVDSSIRNINNIIPGITAGGVFDEYSYQTDNVPYLLRASGGDVVAGRLERDELVGGTVVYYQRISPGSGTSGTNNGITYTNNDDGTWTLNGTSTGSSFRNLTSTSAGAYAVRDGHVYCTFVYGSDNVALRGVKTIDGSSVTVFTNYGAGIAKASVQAEATLSFFRLIIGSGITLDNVIIRPMAFDLTIMFGSTIADYVYSLEQATAGSGIAWLKSYGFFTKDHYPYSEGELMSVSASEHRFVGFNLWDEEWEVGGFDSNGVKNNETTRIRSKNYICVLPNTTYCFLDRLAFNEYDADKTFISSTGFIGDNVSFQPTTFTTGANTSYLMFMATTTYGTTYKNDLCISFSDSTRNGQYKPYRSAWSYPLDPDLELRGIPKLNGSKLYYDGDHYAGDGTVTRWYGVVDLGTLTWSLHSSYASTFYTDISGKAFSNANIICSTYENGGVISNYGSIADKTIVATTSTTAGRIAVKDTSYSTAADFRTAMSGVYLVYKLATPTTEYADPYDTYQSVDGYGTEEYVDERTVPIPVGHETRYYTDYLSALKAPENDGVYSLKVTVANGVPTYSWVSG